MVRKGRSRSILQVDSEQKDYSVCHLSSQRAVHGGFISSEAQPSEPHLCLVTAFVTGIAHQSFPPTTASMSRDNPADGNVRFKEGSATLFVFTMSQTLTNFLTWCLDSIGSLPF